MAWLWHSYDEFIDTVGPVVLTNRGPHGLSLRESTFSAHMRICASVDKLTEGLQALASLGFKGTDQALPRERKLLDAAHRAVVDIIWAGETLLLYNRRLARSAHAYGFLHQHLILPEWRRYAEEERIFYEVARLVDDATDLLSGHHAFVQSDEEFLLTELDLPSDLTVDFTLARNLFSLGFDEVGLLICGRGIEGVLRKIARVRKLAIVEKGRIEPAAEADLHDLIELMYRVRWKRTQARLLSNDTRALLQYLRTLRNAGAHAVVDRSRTTHSLREGACLVASAASRLWSEVAGTRARFESTEIQRQW